MPTELTPEDKQRLLHIAREAITAVVNGRRPTPIEIDQEPSALREIAASFVTLTINGRLRGCIGSLEAHQPLALDVQTRAVQAALEDPRFHQVTAGELPHIHIEISRLTPPVPLEYHDPLELPQLLTPHKDGVILSDGHRRATYLPQVWAQLPHPEEFLASLCVKMGARPNLWREKVLGVEFYQVDEFSEAE